MKKRYLIAGAYGLAGAALAGKLWRRPREVDWEAHRAAIHHGEHSRFAELNGGLRIHYQEAGAVGAPPIILIHGFCASTFVWSDVLLPLAAEGFRVIAMDLVGFGFSDKPHDGEYTIEYQARMIARLMEHLGVERGAVIGSSYGGAVAIACALDFPDCVERLVVVGGISNDEITREKLMRLGAAPILGELVSPLVLSSNWLHGWRMRDVYADNGGRNLWTEERLAAHRLPLRAASTHRAVVRTLRRWSAERIGREAYRITQPTLLIWGDNDTAVPLRHGIHFLSEIPGSRLFIFRRCGHLPQEEYPLEFTQLVAKFYRAELSHREPQQQPEAAITPQPLSVGGSE